MKYQNKNTIGTFVLPKDDDLDTNAYTYIEIA